MEGPPLAETVPEARLDRGVAPVRSGGGHMPARLLARIAEWFWRGRAMAAARARSGVGARELELERRARVAAQLAAQAFEPRERFADGDATFLACELYRESVYWALCAQLRSPATAAPAPSVLWGALDPELLGRVAPDEVEAEALRTAFVGQSFATFAELATDAQVRCAQQLRALSMLLLERLDEAQKKIDALWVERGLRIALIVLVGVIAVLVSVALDRLGPDLARGRPWRASSDWNTGGCKSPQQDCEDSPYYFFHTRPQTDPWVEIDLGAPTAFTKVRVENREDCCYERAVPLVIESSNDRARWEQLAWRKQPFTRWTAEMPPTKARFVRVRVKGPGPLHLKAVRVQP
jgi:hypothetical protein